MQDEDKVINFDQRKRERLAGEDEIQLRTDMPEFIRPMDISRMSESQLETMVNLVRMRRLQSAAVYERTMEEKKLLSAERAGVQLERKCNQVFDELNKTFRNIEKLELRVNEMRALRIQAGLQW